jgi:hypothetical protein
MAACHDLHYEWLRIDRADPRILATRQLLADLLVIGGGPHATLKPGPGAVEIPPPKSLDEQAVGAWIDEQSGRLEGWLLTIRAVNATVIYRIGVKDMRSLAYVAEWPD